MKIAIACDHGGYLLKQDILHLAGGERHRLRGFRVLLHRERGLSRIR